MTLHTYLKAVERLRRRRRALTIGAARARWIIVVFLVGALLDASWALSPSARALVAIALVGAATWTFLGVVRALWFDRRSLTVAAALVEETLGLSDRRPLVVAHSLMSHAEAEGELAAEARRRAERVIIDAPPGMALRTLDDERPSRSFVALTLLALALALLAPRFFAMSAARLFDPLGPHSAYTSARYAIELAPAQPYLGESVRVRVHAQGEGARVDALLLVDPDDRSAVRDRRARRAGAEPDFVIERLDRPVRLAIESRGAWVATTPITPLDGPVIEHASVTVRPPPYTRRRPANQRAEEPGGAFDSVTAPVGSEIDIHVRTTAALVNARLQPSDSALARVDGRAAHATFALRTSGAHELSLDVESASGRRLRAPVRLQVDAIPDAAPTLSFVAPAPSGSTLLATNRGALTMRVRAADDYGVSVIDAAVHLNGERIASERATLEPERRLHEAPLRCDLSLFTPGDELEIIALALDARPESLGGPQRSPSASLRVRIVTIGALEAAINAGATSLQAADGVAIALNPAGAAGAAPAEHVVVPEGSPDAAADSSGAATGEGDSEEAQDQTSRGAATDEGQPAPEHARAALAGALRMSIDDERERAESALELTLPLPPAYRALMTRYREALRELEPPAFENE